VPIVRIAFGERVFAPRWAMTALAAALCVLFVRLGDWQWDKGILRRAEWAAFARGADAPVALGARDTAAVPRFERVRVQGRFDPAHQFLLDNLVHDGAAGYEVLTPFALNDGRMLLVDRGWVPFSGYRSRLPDVRFAASAPLVLTGRIDALPAPGLSLGRTAPAPGASWPKVTSYPDMHELAHALGVPLEPRILLLDPHDPYGYVRDWQPPGISPDRNISYAVQWWGFAVTLIVIWAVTSAPKTSAAKARRPRERH